jgi:hypothetical protein
MGAAPKKLSLFYQHFSSVKIGFLYCFEPQTVGGGGGIRKAVKICLYEVKGINKTFAYIGWHKLKATQWLKEMRRLQLFEPTQLPPTITVAAILMPQTLKTTRQPQGRQVI